MDQKSMQEFFTKTCEENRNFFIFGKEKVGKSCFINKFTRISPSVEFIEKFDFKGNQIISYKFQESTFHRLNFLEITNYDFFSHFNDNSNQMTNYLFFLTENLTEDQNNIIQLVHWLKPKFNFNKCFIVKTKSELNPNKSFCLNETFSSSIGFHYKELSYLNEYFSQEHFNQMFKEDFFEYFKHGSNNLNAELLKTSKHKKSKIFEIRKLSRKSLRKISIHEKSSSHKSNENDKSTSSINVENKFSANSLISISKHLFNFIKTKKTISGKNATQYILKHINQKDIKISFKNIQRRVYDAINVMTAIGFISKDRSFLNYDGVFQVYETDTLKRINILKERICEIKSNIAYHQNSLSFLILKNYFCKKLVEDNSLNNRGINDEEKLNYPFLLIKLGSNAQFTIKEDDTNSRVCIFSDQQFNTIKDEEIMKEFLKNDPNIINFLKKELRSDLFNYIEKNSLLEKYFINYNNSFFKHDYDNYSNLHKNSEISLDNKSYKFSFGVENSKNKNLSEDYDNLDCFEKVDVFLNGAQDSTILNKI